MTTSFDEIRHDYETEFGDETDSLECIVLIILMKWCIMWVQLATFQASIASTSGEAPISDANTFTSMQSPWLQPPRYRTRLLLLHAQKMLCMKKNRSLQLMPTNESYQNLKWNQGAGVNAHTQNAEILSKSLACATVMALLAQ